MYVFADLCAETDINVPLSIRGPGVPSNQTLDVVTSHTDLAPTFLHFAGAPSRKGLDGKSVPFTVEEGKEAKTEHAAIEYWGLVSAILLATPVRLGRLLTPFSLSLKVSMDTSATCLSSRACSSRTTPTKP